MSTNAISPWGPARAAGRQGNHSALSWPLKSARKFVPMSWECPVPLQTLLLRARAAWQPPPNSPEHFLCFTLAFFPLSCSTFLPLAHPCPLPCKQPIPVCPFLSGPTAHFSSCLGTMGTSLGEQDHPTSASGIVCRALQCLVLFPCQRHHRPGGHIWAAVSGCGAPCCGAVRRSWRGSAGLTGWALGPVWRS